MEEETKRQKGITLIALIITIIIMLILVSVTINVAMNGGLFEKAKEASVQMQREADREELLSEVYGTINSRGVVDVAELTISGWTKGNAMQDNENKTYYKFTSPKGYEFYVYDGTGIIVDTEPTPGNGGTPTPQEPVTGEWPESTQVASLNVGDTLICNNENWIVMYNDNTAGLQLIKQQGIQYAGTTITTKNGNNEYDATIAKTAYNTITKQLSDYCAIQNYGLPNTWAIRCVGSSELAPEKALSELTDADYYTYRYPEEGEAQVTITVDDGLRKAAETGDMTPLMTVFERLEKATGSTKLLLPARSIHVSSSQTSIQFYIPVNDTNNPSLQGLRFYLKDSSFNDISPDSAVITAADNWTIFPVAIVKTEGLIINETETPGTYTYSYSE